MKISRAAQREAKQLFRLCLVEGVLDEGRVRQSAQQLAALKPRGYLGILAHFQRLVKLEAHRRTVRVESAVPLPENLRAGLVQRLGTAYGPGLNFAFTENPALIGGARIQVGSDVYDNSIRTRLQRLQAGF